MRTLLVTAALLTATVAGAAELTETIDRTFNVRPGAKVVLNNQNGRITVNSWDQSRVRVIAKKEVDGDRDDVKRALQELRVDMQQRDGGVVVNTYYPKREGATSFIDWLVGDHIDFEVTYEVTVPRSMSVDVSNTNGGIHLANITGAHELDTTNGRIEVKGCGGSLDASTTNGSIRAELLKVAQGHPLHFETTNGSIELALPPNTGATLDAATTNGQIRTDLPVATTSTSSNSLRGTINGGGASLRMRTTNGSITLRGK